MRKLIVFCHLSLDGFAAAQNGKLDWIAYDNDLEKWAESIVAKTGTAIYGHATYELMKYWRTVPADPKATKHELKHARWIEGVEKIVFSKKPMKSDWNNTRVINKQVKEEILKLKRKAGKDITVFGSPTLANSLIQLGLVDEYRLSVSPVVLGAGKALFAGTRPMKLKLLEEKAWKSGLITLHYRAI